MHLFPLLTAVLFSQCMLYCYSAEDFPRNISEASIRIATGRKRKLGNVDNYYKISGEWIRLTDTNIGFNKDNKSNKCLEDIPDTVISCCNPDLIKLLQWNGSYSTIGTVEESFNLLRNKRIILIGDSVTRQLYQFIKVLTETSNIASTMNSISFRIDEKGVEEMSSDGCEENHQQQKTFCNTINSKNVECNCRILPIMFIPQYNVSITLLSFYFFIGPANYGFENDDVNYKGDNFQHHNLHYRLLQYILEKYENVLINTGLHFELQTVFVYSQVIRFIRDSMVEVFVKSNSNKKMAFVNSLPTHFNGLYNEFFARKSNKRPFDCVKHSHEPHMTNTIAKALIGGKVPVLDLSELYNDMGDCHAARSDCVHWCYAYELAFPHWTYIVSFINGTIV